MGEPNPSDPISAALRASGQAVRDAASAATERARAALGRTRAQAKGAGSRVVAHGRERAREAAGGRRVPPPEVQKEVARATVDSLDEAIARWRRAKSAAGRSGDQSGAQLTDTLVGELAARHVAFFRRECEGQPCAESAESLEVGAVGDRVAEGFEKARSAVGAGEIDYSYRSREPDEYGVGGYDPDAGRVKICVDASRIVGDSPYASDRRIRARIISVAGHEAVHAGSGYAASEIGEELDVTLRLQGENKRLGIVGVGQVDHKVIGSGLGSVPFR